MKANEATKVLRWIICSIAGALAVAAWVYNPCHLFTAAIIFAVGLNVECKEKEDRI